MFLTNPYFVLLSVGHYFKCFKNFAFPCNANATALLSSQHFPTSQSCRISLCLRNEPSTPEWVNLEHLGTAAAMPYVTYNPNSRASESSDETQPKSCKYFSLTSGQQGYLSLGNCPCPPAEPTLLPPESVAAANSAWEQLTRHVNETQFCCMALAEVRSHASTNHSES